MVCYFRKLTKIFNTKHKKPIVEGRLWAQVHVIRFKKNILDLVKNYKKYLEASINIIQVYTHKVLLSQNNTILFATIMFEEIENECAC